jgi:hypothetical protein
LPDNATVRFISPPFVWAFKSQGKFLLQFLSRNIKFKNYIRKGKPRPRDHKLAAWSYCFEPIGESKEPGKQVGSFTEK